MLYHTVGSGKVRRERQRIAQFHEAELQSLYSHADGAAHIVVPEIEHSRCGHPSTDLRTHLVFTFKRYAVLMTQSSKQCLRESIDRACARIDAEVLAEHVKHDHVYLLINYPATRAVSEIVQHVCDESTKDLFRLLPASDGCFFDAPYLAVSCGSISDEMIQNYVNS